jgi:hypothetical protein
VTYTRRGWIGGLIGGISLLFCWRRPARGQAHREPSCAGKVSDPKGKGIPDLLVQIVEASGRVTSGKTDGKGEYSLSAPKSSPYLIVFREPQMKTRLLGIAQLTPDTNQVLSMTIDPSMNNFQSEYGTLQAVETLVAWVIAEPNFVRTTLFAVITARELLDVLDTFRSRAYASKFGTLPLQFLEHKMEFVRYTLMELSNLEPATRPSQPAPR